MKIGTNLPVLLKNHLSDFIVMPILLSCTLFSMRMLIKNSPRYVFSYFQLGFAFVYAALVFEYFGPKVFTGKTADELDVIAYAAGTLYFAVFMNKAPQKINE
jgi:hypothetical protein